jgi:hypothetical protein
MILNRNYLALLLTGILLTFSIEAAEIYRWVDAQGQVHFSDAIPTAKGTKALPVDLRATDVSDQQRQEAKERQAKDLERLKKPKTISEPTPTTPPPQTSKPPAPLNPDASCEEQWAAFDQSWACFNPYRTANGSIKGEAFEHCSELSAPACTRAAK